MTRREELLAVARAHDPEAEWASDEFDENCMLVAPHVIDLLYDRDPDAYEEPNPAWAKIDFTRIIFPNLD